MNSYSCSLEEYSPEKNISNQMDISPNEKVEIFNISPENIQISKEQLNINSKILFSLIPNKEELVKFIANLYNLKNNSQNTLEEIGETISDKLNYLFFVSDKVEEFSYLLNNYNLEEYDEDFELFLENLDDDIVNNKSEILHIIMLLTNSLKEFFAENNKEINYIVKENILNIEKFLRSEFNFNSYNKFNYIDNEYLYLLKIMESLKLGEDLKLDSLKYSLLDHPYYSETELLDYLYEGNFMSYSDIDSFFEKVEDPELQSYEYFYKEKNDDISQCEDDLNKFISDNIYHNLDNIFIFLNKYPNSNSSIFLTVLSEVKNEYKNKKIFLNNYVLRYGLDEYFIV